MIANVQYSLAAWDTLLVDSCNNMGPFELVEPCQVLPAFAKVIEAVVVAMAVAVAVAAAAVDVVCYFHSSNNPYINISFIKYKVLLTSFDNPN